MKVTTCFLHWNPLSLETVQIAGNPQTLYPLVEGNLPKKEK